MKPDLYEEWVHHEVLEKGFQEPLWSIAKEETKGDEVLAKVVYVNRRKEQLIDEGVELSDGRDRSQHNRFIRHEPSPDFFSKYPVLVRFLGMLLSLLLVILGIWIMKNYGLR